MNCCEGVEGVMIFGLVEGLWMIEWNYQGEGFI